MEVACIGGDLLNHARLIRISYRSYDLKTTLFRSGAHLEPRNPARCLTGVRHSGSIRQCDVEVDFRRAQNGVAISIEHECGGIDCVPVRYRNARWMKEKAQARGSRGQNLKDGAAAR